MFNEIDKALEQGCEVIITTSTLPQYLNLTIDNYENRYDFITYNQGNDTFLIPVSQIVSVKIRKK